MYIIIYIYYAQTAAVKLLTVQPALDTTAPLLRLLCSIAALVHAGSGELQCSFHRLPNSCMTTRLVLDDFKTLSILLGTSTSKLILRRDGKANAKEVHHLQNPPTAASIKNKPKATSQRTYARSQCT